MYERKSADIRWMLEGIMRRKYRRRPSGLLEEYIAREYQALTPCLANQFTLMQYPSIFRAGIQLPNHTDSKGTPALSAYVARDRAIR